MASCVDASVLELGRRAPGKLILVSVVAPLTYVFVLVMSSLNSSNHGTVSSRQLSEAYKARPTITTMKMAKMMTWFRNSPS